MLGVFDKVGAKVHSTLPSDCVSKNFEGIDTKVNPNAPQKVVKKLSSGSWRKLVYQIQSQKNRSVIVRESVEKM